MTEPSTLTTAIKLAQTKPKQIQAVNNTIPNLTIIHYRGTTEETNRVDDRHNP